MWRINWNLQQSLLVLSVLFFGCAGRQTAILERPLPPSQPAANAAALQKDAENLWAQRSDPLKARQALEAFKRAYAAHPNREMGTKLSRAYYFIGDYIETDPDSQAARFLSGLETGERALSLNNDFRMKYLKTKDDKRALALLDRTWTPTLYWTAANLAQWTEKQPWRVRYGNKGRAEIFMSRLRELEPNYYYGGAYRYFAVLPTRGRAPFVDLDDSKRAFEAVVALAPNFLANKRLYAETYAVKKKDRALFTRLLNEVIAAKIDNAAEMAPENKYEQARAQKMLAAIERYFEK